MSPPPRPDRSWLTYGSVLGVLSLLAAALLTTAGTTFVSVRNASRVLLRGQTDVLERSVRSHLLSAGEPSQEDLDALLQDEAESGLRYVAYVDRSTGARLEAGTALAPLEMVGLEPRAGRTEGDRIRAIFPLGAHRPFRKAPGVGRAHAGWVVMELDPVESRALRSAANRTLAAGSTAALVLLTGAALLLRRALQREAEARKEEQARRLASLGEMSAVLAHEIRNPLASLKGNAQLLEQSLPPGEKAQAKAQRVVEEALRLEKLTNDLLDYVRAGQLQRRDLDPGALAREAAASVNPTIAVDTARAPAAWNLDGDRLRQVLVNLLDNAVQAGLPVAATVRTEGAALCIEVRDHGGGVAKEERDRIFEPFYTRRTRGTGLGLSVARRVVELHGGSLSVDDAPGGGACFRLRIPRG